MKDLQELTTKMLEDREVMYKAEDQFRHSVIELINALIDEVDLQGKYLSLEDFNVHYSFVLTATKNEIKEAPIRIYRDSSNDLYLESKDSSQIPIENVSTKYLEFLMTWIINAYELED